MLRREGLSWGRHLSGEAGLEAGRRPSGRVPRAARDADRQQGHQPPVPRHDGHEVPQVDLTLVDDPPQGLRARGGGYVFQELPRGTTAAAMMATLPGGLAEGSRLPYRQMS